MPNLAPWHGKTLAELGLDHPHDDERCPVCTPIMRSPAWARGVARAHQVQTHLPMSSAPDAKAGRDGYDQGE